MPPTPRIRRGSCQVCNDKESKYTCSACLILYCSVGCYKSHKVTACSAGSNTSPESGVDEKIPSSSSNTVTAEADDILEEPKPLKPLSSLKWPYVPEEPSYPDPLQRNDPKPLQIRHYEAIATSPAVRNVLSSNPNLPALLTSIDKLRGFDRERALEKALEVTAPELVDDSRTVELEDDVLALRALVGAIEDAVRGGKEDALGLDWT